MSFTSHITCLQAKREPQNFLSHAFLRDKEDMMVASTDSGEIVLFKNNDWKQILQHSPADNKTIDCIIPFSKGFLCGCEDGVVRMFEKSDNAQEVFKVVHKRHIKIVVMLTMHALNCYRPPTATPSSAVVAKSLTSPSVLPRTRCCAALTPTRSLSWITPFPPAAYPG